MLAPRSQISPDEPLSLSITEAATSATNGQTLGLWHSPNGHWMLMLAAVPTPLTCTHNDLVEVLAVAAQYYAEFPRQQWRMVDEEHCRETIMMRLQEGYPQQFYQTQ